jgi:glycosyltransferase involved in cell wall biosynthesis
MKILFCYQFCSLGGCETVLSTRMHELIDQGIDVHVIFFDGGDGLHLFNDLGDRMRICRTRAEVEAKLTEVQPDYLISLDTPNIVKHLEDRPANLKFVYEVHSTYPTALKRLRLLNRYGLSAIFTPSEAQRNLVLSLLGSSLNCPIEVIPNPLRRNFGEESPSAAYGRPVVLWVGRLDAHKNWRGFLEICRELHEKNSELEYWVVGTSTTTDDEKTQLWEEAKRTGLVDRFRWLPHVPYDRIDRLYRFAANSGGCLVSTSKQESFGMVAAEAMACSCPVVVPDIGGFRDFVQHERTGFRYPAGQQRAAVQYILKVIGDEPSRRRIVAAGRDLMQREYSARSSMLKLIDTLENLPMPVMREKLAG